MAELSIYGFLPGSLQAPRTLASGVFVREDAVLAKWLLTWLVRSPSPRSIPDEFLAVHVPHSFAGSDRTQRARRFWSDLLALGQQSGLHRI